MFGGSRSFRLNKYEEALEDGDQLGWWKDSRLYMREDGIVIGMLLLSFHRIVSLLVLIQIP